MRAGPYIRAQIEQCKHAAAHYRAQAADLRKEADELERFAAEHDEQAAKWAAGTDLALVG